MNPVAEQRGFTEILRESPSGPLDACYIPIVTTRGGVSMMRKAVFRPAVSELVRLGLALPARRERSRQDLRIKPADAKLAHLNP